MKQDILNALKNVYWKGHEHTHAEESAVNPAFEQIKGCLEEPISKILFTSACVAKNLSKDKRRRVGLQDEVDWLEEKMKEIRKQANKLSKGLGHEPKKR